MSLRVTFTRHAHRRLLNHAREVARSRGAEAIGWLLGYFTPGAVSVLDSAGAARYKSQSRYGAQGDPTEEQELANRYPRNVGIVGLYHSHPFRDETRHAIFHSETDDRTLRSRASRRGEYLSVVTDGRDAEVFVLREEPSRVEPEVVSDLSYRDALKRYTCELSMHLRKSFAIDRMDGLLGVLEHDLSQEIERSVGRSDVTVNATSGVVTIPGLAGGGAHNTFTVEARGEGAAVNLEVHSEVVVYIPPGEDVLAVLKEEIQDDVVYLLWHGLDPRTLRGPVANLHANLGTLRVQETNPLPRRLYRASGRAVVRKGPRPAT